MPSFQDRLRAALPNLLLLRADLPGFWRGLNAAGIGVDVHYLLYPNPWPKQHQLARRWHGHAVLPELLALGGRLELRCNWDVYAREFAFALTLSGVGEVVPERLAVLEPITAFERKFATTGQALYRVSVELSRGKPEAGSPVNSSG